MAGTDSSALTMEWALSLLLNHPSVLTKAKAEIKQVVGVDHLVKESDLPNLKYLHCIVNDAHRLFPSGPLLASHRASQDCTIGGYHVSKDTMLLVNAWAIHRSPNNWPDPATFRPERFLDLELEATKYKFLPFGVGRRACPGIGLANRVVGLCLATLIQCFECERVSDELIDMAEGNGFSMPKLHPLVALCKPDPYMVPILSHI